MSKSVESFLRKDDDGRYVTVGLDTPFENSRDAAAFLIQLIVYWQNKNVSLFCNEWQEEDGDWIFNYKTPSTCGGCVRAQRVLNNIFPTGTACFNALLFVENVDDRQCQFRLRHLKAYADHGLEHVRQLVAREKDRKRQAEEEKRLENRVGELKALLGGGEVDEQVFQGLLKLGKLRIAKVVHPQLVVAVTDESDYRQTDSAAWEGSYSPDINYWMYENDMGNPNRGVSKGISYFDSVHVFFRSAHEVRSWKWRDGEDPSNDKPWLAVHGIGAVEVSEQGNVVRVEVENSSHGNRMVEFTF